MYDEYADYCSIYRYDAREQAPPGVRVLMNVATLLRETPGAARRVDAAGEVAEVHEEHYRRPLQGEVRLLRTARGVLVRANLTVVPEYECGRCLKPYSTPVDLVIEELYVFTRDPITLVAVDAEPDEFRLGDDQYLDLSEAVRQYEESARPLAPLCREDCAGLCPTCGTDLNDGPCACAANDLEPAWSALTELASRLRTGEVSDGRS
jgi:uncharacterized protein